MTFRNFLVLTAVISGTFGAAFILFPKMMADLYGVPFSPEVAMLDRFFGTAMFGLGLFAWALKDITDTTLISRVLVAHGAHDVIGVLVASHATTTHALNSFGWGSALIYGVLATGCVILYRNGSTATYRTA